MLIKIRRLSPFLWSNAILPILICGVSILLLMNTSWYTDDQESLVRGYFLDDLYLKQWSVHFPLLAILSGLVDQVLGQSWYVNRLMALAANCGSIWFTQKAFIRIRAGSNKNFDKNLWKQVLYFSPQIIFLTNSYAHTNITALWTMLFMAILVSRLDWIALESQSLKIRSLDCLFWGLLSACVVCTRVLSGLQLTFLFLTFLFFASWKWKNIFFFFFGSVIGLSGFIIWLWQSEKWNDFIFWTLIHNAQVKKGINIQGYIGDLSSSHVPWFWVMALMGILPIVFSSKIEKSIKRVGWVLVLGFLGGIFSANPSGINTSLQHALPTFPFLTLLIGLAVTNLSLESFKKTYMVLLSLGFLSLFPRILGDVNDANTVMLKEQTLKDGETLKTLVRPDEKIILLGVNPIIYYFADRHSGSFASIILPDLISYQDRLIENAKAPDVRCFYVEDYGYWLDRNSAAFAELYAYVYKETTKKFDRIYCK